MHCLIFLTPRLTELARISYAYRTPILLISVLVALGFAGILLSSKEAKQIAGSWVKYVGWAFLAYSFQYLFRLIGWLMRDEEGRVFSYFKVAANFLANVGSGANNLFFLAAALILLNWRTPFLRTRIFIVIVATTATFTTVANFHFVEKDSPWAALFTRLPDALISACCLGLFGFAVMMNFLSHRLRYWAIGAVLIALFYSSIQIIYAATPVWAKDQESEIQKVLVKGPYGPKTTPVDFLDSALFALALPMKMLLFVPAFYLFFTLIIAAHDFRKVLRAVKEQKKSYFSSEGIVKSIGQSVPADSVKVFIKLPGSKPPAAWYIPWPRDNAPRFIVLDPQLNPNVDRQLLKVFDGHETNPIQDSGEWRRQIHTSLLPKGAEPLMLPVKFHGAVVGCLQATFSSSRKVNYATLQQLSSMADLLAPAVQDYRALASLDQLSDRFTRLQVQKPGSELQDTIQEIGNILHDVLSPLATGLLLDAGFKANHVLLGEGDFLRLLDGQTVRYEPEDLTKVKRDDTGKVKIYKNQLTVIPRDDVSEMPLGNLVLILPSEHDEINRPTLGDYKLHRRSIASQAADAFLDLVREHFSYELNMLSVSLNTDALSQELWLKSIQDTAKRVGLIWVVVTQIETPRTWGDADGEKIISNLDEDQRSALEAKPISCIVYRDESTQTHHVMRIDLEKSKHQVWFGIAREGFGLELDFPSPWRAFLEDFRDIVDSSLFSLFEVQKSKETLARLAEERGVMNIAITTGHLMHELANKVDAQQLPAESLWRAVERGAINLDTLQRAQMKAILNGATVMKDLIAIFKNVTKTDDRRVFTLREVAARALQFYEQMAVQSGIKLRNRVKDDLWIDMPYNVVLFSIANLVGNSKEAVEERVREGKDGYIGEIRIEAKVENDFVICYIVDNGPGVPDHLKDNDNLYHLGSSDKQGHNGWGLYLTNQSLVQHGGEIKLIESSRGLTKFSLKFPKAKSP